MGNLVQTMKKILFFFCFLISLRADPSVDALKQEVCTVLPTLEGWCSKSKALAFIDLVLETKPEVYVEIGVFGGSSLYPVASALKYLGKGTIIGIDPWDKIECIKYFDPVDDAEHLKWWGSLNINYVYQSLNNMLRKHKLENYVKIIKETSEEATSQIDEIDILHLDGNHSEFCSIQDVELYLPKVKKGGYIWMNDTLWKERQDAVDLLVETCDVIRLLDNGNCILFRKK